MQHYKTTTFLNVDLDIYSRLNLEPLVTGLGQRIVVYYVGRNRRTYEAHLALAFQPKNADVAIRRFAVLIDALPRAQRKLWDTARFRDFSIGVQAAMKPHSFELPLAPETVETASKLKARIVFTIYAPEVPRKGNSKKRMQ